jgi:hypothetical protein
MSEKTNGSQRKNTNSTLTREQRHLLLKSLVCAQINDEWTLLDEPEGLSQYGPPFINSGSQAPKAVGSHSETFPEFSQRPLILLDLFHSHLRRFPGLKGANVTYWQKRIVPFFEKVSKAVYSNCQERYELTNRRLLAFVATRYIATFWTRGIGLRGEGETKGPGRGEAGSEKWGVGKKWGKGTVKRGLERPVRPTKRDMAEVQALFGDEEDDEIVWQSAERNVNQLKKDWSAWKESIIESEDGLESTLLQLQTKSINNLPSEYRNAAIWVRRHVAWVLWSVFVQYPGGDDILSIIKLFHTLFPYWGAKQLLKIANAQKMIKAIIDMLLARPMGMVDSLAQRIFFAIMNSEISFINKTFLTPLRKEIKDDNLCTLIDQYVKNRTYEQRATILRDAREQNQDCLINILQDYGYDNVDEIRLWHKDFLSSPLRSNVDWAYPSASLEAKKMTAAFGRAPPNNIQAKQGALKFAQLKLYLRERLRRNDREKVLELGSGPLVPDIIKDSLEIVFYSLIYQIALNSDLSSRLGDLQRFVDDLIRTKTKKEDDLEDWIALCARHENSLYLFVHEIRDAVKPVFDWCQEALDYMATSSTQFWNLTNKKNASNVEIDLDQLLQDVKRGGDVDVDAVLEELEVLKTYTKWYKLEQVIQMQSEFVNIREDSVTKETKMPTKDRNNSIVQPSNNMKKRLDEKCDLLKILMERQGVEPDDGMVRNRSRGTEAGQLPWGFFAHDDILHQHTKASKNSAPLQYTVENRVTSQLPAIPHIRSLLPAFRRALRRKLPDWYTKATC